MRPFLLLFLSACAVDPDGAPSEGAPADEDWAERVLVNVRGCGDATVAASNPSDTLALFVSLPGIVQQAHAAGRPITLTRTLPSTSIGVSVQVGTALTSATCVGALPWPGPAVSQSAEAAAGTITVTATPFGGSMAPQAMLDVEIQGLGIVTAAGTLKRLGDVEMYDVGVGLYPP